MEIRDTDRCRIITILSPKLSEHQAGRLKDELDAVQDKRIGIDMSCVQDCTIDFIDVINEKKGISLFNIQSDIFALLISMGLDKSLCLFVSEPDFICNRRRLLNRKFCIVS